VQRRVRAVQDARTSAHYVGRMLRYLLRRIMWAAVLFVAVTAVTYVLFFLIPTDPARQACGQRASNACIELARETLGLDRPVYVQYALFMERLVVHQNLGRSFVNRQSVNEIVLDAAPVTASLVFGGAVLWLLIAVPTGILSALRPRSLLDRTAMVGVLIGISAHPIWIGLILSYFIGHRLGLTPLGGYCDFINPPATAQCGGPVDWFHALILPWMTFMLLFSALYVRMIRANVLETMNEDYVRTARAKGAPESQVMRSHVMRNAMLPIVTMLGMDIGLALGGAIFTETVFGLPGLGREAVRALEGFDIPTVMGITVFATLGIIFFNLVVDLLYAVIDPRIRLS
jgi:peptide/nickel transport system permease protein